MTNDNDNLAGSGVRDGGDGVCSVAVGVREVAWGALWKSVNKLDGDTCHLIHQGALPAIFKTRKQAREFIAKEYGYIRNRDDLKQEPHGWRFPQPVRVKVEMV